MAFEEKNVAEVCAWLRTKPWDFVEEVVEAFSDQDMDGEAIATAFATLPGPDCLRDVLPKLGVRLKVYSAIKQQLQCETNMQSPNPSPQPRNFSDTSSYGFSPMVKAYASDGRKSPTPYPLSPQSSITHPDERKTPTPYPLSPQSTATHESSELKSTTTSTTPSRKQPGGSDVVLNPFPVPKFRPATEKNLEKKHTDR